jgi:hypothetical protein
MDMAAAKAVSWLAADGFKTLTLYFSASCTMRSMSSLDNRPLSFVMVILFFVPAGPISK